MLTKNNLIKNIVLVAISQVIGRGGVTLSGMMVSLLIGSQAFSAFSYFHLTGSLLSTISVMGMANAVSRYYARLEFDADGKIRSQLGMVLLITAVGLSVTLLLMNLAPDSLLKLKDPVDKPILSFLLISIVLNTFLLAAANGLEKFSKLAKATALQGGGTLFAAILAVIFSDVDIALWGYVLANLVCAYTIAPDVWRATIRAPGPRLSPLTCRTLRSVLGYCLPIFISSILYSSAIWGAGRVLLSDEFDPLEFAAYAMGFQLFSLALTLPNIVNKVISPKVTKWGVLRNLQHVENPVFLSLLASSISASFFSLALVLGGEWIASFYGAEMLPYKNVLTQFAIAALLASPINAIGSAMLATHYQLQWLMLGLFWWATFVVAMLFFSVSGALGVAVSFVIAYSVHLPVSLCVAVRLGLLRRNADKVKA